MKDCKIILRINDNAAIKTKDIPYNNTTMEYSIRKIPMKGVSLQSNSLELMLRE